MKLTIQKPGMQLKWNVDFFTVLKEVARYRWLLYQNEGDTISITGFVASIDGTDIPA